MHHLLNCSLLVEPAMQCLLKKDARATSGKFPIRFSLSVPSLCCILSMSRQWQRVWVIVERSLVFFSNVNNIIKNYSIPNLKMNIRGKNVEGRLRQFTSLKWNSIQNISKVHMQDLTDFGLFTKFRRPNENWSNFDAIFVSKYDVTTASFSHYA